MEEKIVGQAGTEDAGDIMIRLVVPSDEGITVELNSKFEVQFGEAIRSKIKETLLALGVTAVCCRAEDNGALDFTVAARVEAAVADARRKGELA